jgi:hypothetical protein
VIVKITSLWRFNAGDISQSPRECKMQENERRAAAAYRSEGRTVQWANQSSNERCCRSSRSDYQIWNGNRLVPDIISARSLLGRRESCRVVCCASKSWKPRCSRHTALVGASSPKQLAEKCRPPNSEVRRLNFLRSMMSGLMTLHERDKTCFD